MSIDGEYLGMSIRIDETDQDNYAFYSYCGQHELRVQQCSHCQMMRCPPTTACPFCAHPESSWVQVSGRGTVYSYGEVHHAIQPVFRSHAPYLLLLVELNEQRGEPGEFDGLRMQGNLANAEADFAAPDVVAQVGIGTRVKVVFKDCGTGIAMPLWTIDPDAEQPAEPWRYAIE